MSNDENLPAWITFFYPHFNFYLFIVLKSGIQACAQGVCVATTRCRHIFYTRLSLNLKLDGNIFSNCQTPGGQITRDTVCFQVVASILNKKKKQSKTNKNPVQVQSLGSIVFGMIAVNIPDIFCWSSGVFFVYFPVFYIFIDFCNSFMTEHLK